MYNILRCVLLEVITGTQMYLVSHYPSSAKGGIKAPLFIIS